ncbi:MAG: hypothetical protein KF795_06040 [Labilithrix sp.]|nr:hypothetical protein [Labilithrix sp.]
MSDREERRPPRGPSEPEEAAREPERDLARDELDPPPSAEEALASRRLRDALEDPSSAGAGEDLDLVSSLRAAWSPGALDEGVHAEMLDDLPTAEEIALAAELREALDAARPEATPELVAALRSAWNPTPLGADEHRAIVGLALEKAPLEKAAPARQGAVLAFAPRARTMRLAAVSATTVLALAASVVVWLTTAGPRAEAPLARARSTQPLFGEPFKPGETSARIDRIALARASDYRDNRFAKWGVR